MPSPVPFDRIEGEFRDNLLGSYTRDFAFGAYGPTYVVNASATKPAYFRGTVDLMSKPFYAVLSGLLSPKGVDLKESAIGYHICSRQSLEVAASGKVNYTYKDDTFNISATTNLLDGLPTDASVSTLICKGAAAGAAVSYDPSRSGLKNYTFTLVADRVKELRDAKVLAKLDATEGYGLGLTFPVRPDLSVTALIGRRECKLGARLLSPCGAAVSAFVDAVSRSLALTATKGTGEGWKVSVSATIKAEEPTAPAFGVSFTAE
jgi:hypothetical protein